MESTIDNLEFKPLKISGKVKCAVKIKKKIFNDNDNQMDVYLEW